MSLAVELHLRSDPCQRISHALQLPTDVRSDEKLRELKSYVFENITFFAVCIVIKYWKVILTLDLKHSRRLSNASTFSHGGEIFSE